MTMPKTVSCEWDMQPAHACAGVLNSKCVIDNKAERTQCFICFVLRVWNFVQIDHPTGSGLQVNTVHITPVI